MPTETAVVGMHVTSCCVACIYRVDVEHTCMLLDVPMCLPASASLSGLSGDETDRGRARSCSPLV